MKDMTPVRFQGKDGQTLAVGDKIWVKQGRQVDWGCVTGFSFDEDSLSGVDVSVSRQDWGTRTVSADLDEVFATERDAYHSVLEDLKIQRDSLARETSGLDNQIVQIRMEWGERVNE